MANYSEAHICQCLTRLTTARLQCTVTINGERRKTGLQFVEGVMAVSYRLLQLGIKPGNVVSISALNCDLYLEWMLAIAFVGGIAAPLNYRWNLEEAKSAMEVSRPVLLVTDSNHGYWHSRFTIDSVKSLVWHVLMDTPGKANDPGMMFATELLKEPSGICGQPDYLWAPKGAAIICFTSGTTGRPKGVTISHSALVVQSLAKIAIVGYDENDVYLHTAPLCHIGGISSALALLMAGGCHVMIPKFEANLASEAIQEHRVSTLITVPTIMADLVAFNRTRSFESVKKILNGGGGLSVELIKDAKKLFPRAKLLSAYGMTEACSSLTFLTLYDPNKGSSSHLDTYFEKGSNMCNQGGTCVGKSAPHVELKLLYPKGSESESESESVAAGRILMRGPHAMLGYWDAQTPSKISSPAQEGWLDTGDVGRIDGHGNLWLLGRAKDRIKSGGENIYPEEVEAVLSQHPGISSIVVVGVPDSRLTEMVIACVRAKDGWRWVDSSASLPAEEQLQCLSNEILRHFCREKHLTGFKIPKRFLLWRSTFPVTTTGKLRRDRVREGVMSRTSFVSSKL